MSLNKKMKIKIFRNLIRGAQWDDFVLSLLMRGELIGFYHPGQGGIATGAAVGSLMEDDDILWPHHRAHGMVHMLSKGVDLKYYLAEHTGKETGCCKGRSSFHFCFPEHHFYTQSGFIGMNFPLFVGHGFAAKMNGQGQVVAVCSGDGSYGSGRAHEALLFAANMKLPMIFICENNGFSVFAEVEKMHPTENIASLADGFGMPSTVVDGQDVFAVAEVVDKAIKNVRKGKGPILIESKTCRYLEHDIGTPDLKGYTPRTKEEIAKLKERDPVRMATEQVLESGLLTQEDIDSIYAEAKAEIEAAEQFAKESPIPQPTEEELLSQVFAP